MKKIIAFCSFGLYQLLLVVFTVEEIIDHPETNLTRKILLALIACVWFLAFVWGAYKAYKLKTKI